MKRFFNNREQPQLRARDHRLLATWSYFFSSQLSRIYLSWSSIIHVSLVNNKTPFPNVLEHSLVALCYTDQIEQVNSDYLFFRYSISKEYLVQSISGVNEWRCTID